MENNYINLNEKNISFDIVCCRNNKYALVIFENGIGYVFDVFKKYDDATSTFIDIINDYDNGLIELFCKKGRWKQE